MKLMLLLFCCCFTLAIAELSLKKLPEPKPLPHLPKEYSPVEDEGPGFDGPDHDSCKKEMNCDFLNYIWAKDSQHIHLDTVDFHGVIPDLDPKTFMLFDPKGESPYAKDAKKVFYYDKQVPNVDLETFQQVNDRHGKDKKHVYQGTKIIPEADPSSFTSFPHNAWYAKDSRHVYYSGQIVVDADPNTFIVLRQQGKCGEKCWFDAQDKQNKFANGKKVQTIKQSN